MRPAVFAAVLLVGLAALAVSPWRVSPYVSAQWLLDYDLEFVKRGIVGAVLPVEDAATIRLSALILAALATASYAALAATLRRYPPEALGFVLLGLLSGQALGQFRFDLGRFDQIGFVGAVAALLLLRQSTRPAAMLAAGTAVALAILAHEAMAVVFVPLLAALVWTAARRAVPWFLAPIAVAFLAVSTVGALDTPLAEACAHYPVDCRSLHPLAMPLTHSWAATMATVLNPRYAVGGAILATIGLAWFVLFASVNRPWLVALAFSPLALSLVGVDWGRWLHLAVLNGVLLTLHTLSRNEVRFELSRSVGVALVVVLVASFVPGSTVEIPRLPAAMTLR
jgi:hypothetical protein